uniref:polysaccharide biosynthesis C-terminal domain-containing protein n=1 Tax=uncultured Brachyspira sp. TaxID=221953 RepID=UPI002610859B
MSNKKFNLKIATVASWLLLFFAWIFFYAVTQRPTAVFWVVLVISSIMTIITLIVDRKNIVSFFKMRFVHKAFFGILSLIITLAILVGLYIISINFPIRFDLTQNKSYTVSVIIGAIVNLMLNIPLIIYLGTVGASIATVISEMSVTVYQLFIIHKQLNLHTLFSDLSKY